VIGDRAYNRLMWKQVLAGFAVCALVVGGCFMFNETPTSASENEMAAAPQARQPAPSPIQVRSASGAKPRVQIFDSEPAARLSGPAKAAPSPIGIQSEPTAAQQMQALDRHARVGMICYPGRFGPSDAPAIALMVNQIVIGDR
jgi:hypothetical protein